LIPKEYVFNFLTEWKPYFLEHCLSFFEITTGLAFKWFADSGVEVAVIEVGLGGRLDSTNVLEKPSLSIVTTIGLDHCTLLGHTLPEVAAEKAGIFKAGVPALVGESQEETAPVFKEKAWMNCPLTFADHVRPSLWYRHAEILKKMDLRAPVQEKNLRTVLAAVDILKELPAFQALNKTEQVLEGIENTARNMHFHGRWERLSEQPYVLADIGHNAQALQHNFKELEALVQSGRFSSLIIVYGIMADKDLDAILPLMPQNATYIFTTPDTPRALPAGEILRRFTEFRGGASTRAFFSSSVRQAVQMAIQLAQNLGGPASRSASAENLAPAIIYIGGSTFVVAEAVPLF
jgi:dihydrofolate synthase/folylpolyglutamate synthase